MLRAVIVADLGFGDSGKGTVTDALVRRFGAELVVRHNGGAQAGHTVVLEDGRFHTFSQIGAGAFVPGVRTLLSRYMVVHPGGLLQEAACLAGKGIDDALERVTIDPRARVITPFHQAANRLREVLRGEGRHGSCGLGVGETMQHSLEYPQEGVVAADLLDPNRLRKKLCRIQQRYWQEFASQRRRLTLDPLGASEMTVLESFEASQLFLEQAALIAPRVSFAPDLLPAEGTVIFEGAQGVLLDEWRGFHPYTTWSTCTFDNALDLLGGPARREVEVFRLGVVRGYATRHGAGPFPTEDATLTWPEPHNSWGPWQHGFRLGWLDAVLLRYAVDCCGGIDGLAVTHLDRVDQGCKVARDYWDIDLDYFCDGRLRLGRFTDLDYQERLGQAVGTATAVYDQVSGPQQLCRLLSQVTEAPVVLTSYGPTAADKRWEGQLWRLPRQCSSAADWMGRPA